MCQPIPASPSSRTERLVQVSRPSSATKNKSAIDGMSQCTAGGCAIWAEVVEPFVIALNLIECNHERQDGRSNWSGRGASRVNCRSGFRRPECRPVADESACEHHGYRPA